MKTFNLSSARTEQENDSQQQQQHYQQHRHHDYHNHHAAQRGAALIINFKCQATSRAILWYLLLVFNYMASL